MERSGLFCDSLVAGLRSEPFESFALRRRTLTGSPLFSFRLQLAPQGELLKTPQNQRFYWRRVQLDAGESLRAVSPFRAVAHHAS